MKKITKLKNKEKKIPKKKKNKTKQKLFLNQKCQNQN